MCASSFGQPLNFHGIGTSCGIALLHRWNDTRAVALKGCGMCGQMLGAFRVVAVRRIGFIGFHETVSAHTHPPFPSARNESWLRLRPWPQKG